ncbi:MAG: MBL fold metallo-hydrolase [Clostridia bacterium]|nr:MBL fold metallo-hydrolase [Clostridia bacterium]
MGNNINNKSKSNINSKARKLATAKAKALAGSNAKKKANEKSNSRAYSKKSSRGNIKVHLSKKASKKIFVVVVAIVLVLAICAGLIYWKRPDMFWQGYAWVQDLFDRNDNQSNPLTLGEGELQIHFIDVGQGDCILILLPDGKSMMIDAGNGSNSSTYLSSTLDYIDDYLADGIIDYMMLTHADSDHCYFIDEVIAQYDVNTFYMPNILSTRADDRISNASIAQFTDDDTIDTICYANFFNSALLEADAEIVLNIGTIVIETENYRLTCYCPTAEFWENNSLSTAEKKNAISPIVILEYNGFKVVLTGDSNEINEPIFMDRVGEPVNCDVLKVAHHGSETSSIPSFLDFVDCEYAVVSVGENDYGHPSVDTLDRLAARDMTIYRTDQNGNIILSITSTINFSLAKSE